MADPIVLISSYPPDPCPLAEFCDELHEFLQRQFPERPVVVISRRGVEGPGILPIIDLEKPEWWKDVQQKLFELGPHVIHVQHDYGLYEHRNGDGCTYQERGFLELLQAIRRWPTVVEAHTIHGQMSDGEADFIHHLCDSTNLVLFKCHYQRWRLDWTLPRLGWAVPGNIMIVPHGARPDRRYGVHEVPTIRRELGLDQVPPLDTHLLGLMGYIHSNRRWEILTSMWEDLAREIHQHTGQQWHLLASGSRQSATDAVVYDRYRNDILQLERKGLAHYWEHMPENRDHHKMMAVCDFLVLPSTEETHSRTLTQIIALNKPFITAAPMEGTTVQTLESGGGMLFSNKHMLRDAVLRLACDEQLRLRLGTELKRYLDEVVSWEVVTGHYREAYELARQAQRAHTRVEVSRDF